MNRFEFDTKNMIMITCVIIMIFFLFIGKAFDKLQNPETTSNKLKQTSTIVEDTVNNEETDDDIDVDEEIKQIKKKSLNINLQSYVDVPPEPAVKKIAPIQATEEMDIIEPDFGSGKISTNDNSSETLTKDDKIAIKFYKAQKDIENRNLNDAIEEYQNIFDLASDNGTRAKCYEGIAEVYAIQKRYGSALNYAQRAYNASPTSKRELLVARLYYKTGNINEATNRINNILKRDFADDKN